MLGKAPLKLAKSFATATKTTVPLQVHGIEGRYATALYSACAKKGLLKKVEQELKTIQSAIKADPKMTLFLESPVLSRDAKKKGVSSMLPASKYNELTRNLFLVLAENSRLAFSNKVIDSFNQIMAAGRGEVKVNVTSAKPLDKAVVEKLRGTLSKSKLVDANQTIVLQTTVNPSIVGGLIVEVGDKTIDLSISSRLTKLNRLLAESI